jgi:RNA polymerase sigma-70 factor, ECF subfamily
VFDNASSGASASTDVGEPPTVAMAMAGLLACLPKRGEGGPTARICGIGRVSSFRSGVEAAIPALRRYARALTRDTETADDLVQDTVVRALRSEHLFHGGDVRSWLYTILTNLNRNRLRSLARRPVMTLLGDDDAPDMSGPEAGSRDIERALASLVEEQRAALLLVVLEGLTYREVAEVQGVPVGTVMSRLARARAQIKAFLDGERPLLRRVK